MGNPTREKKKKIDEAKFREFNFGFRFIARGCAGTCGILLFRLGDTQYHLCVAFSAPRNFYTHANVLCAGVTAGAPVLLDEGGGGGARALFNRMYHAKEEELGDLTKNFFFFFLLFGMRVRQ